MRLLLKRMLIAVAVLLAVAYVYDYLSVLHRKAAHMQGDPFDSVTYPHLLAIPQKGNRVEYALDAQSPMMTEPCVHSLFPHEGYSPCWYVSRKAQSPTPMFLLPTARFL
ncbi:MAG: hypothetical protein LAO08_04095 [Acidobacteriia bacterium]|nr:hypothetical protein [Terriglobia bacterium]